MDLGGEGGVKMGQDSVARYEVTQFVKDFRLLGTPQPWMVLVCGNSYRLCHSSEVWNERATVFTNPRKLLASVAVLGGCICLNACIRFLSGDILCAEMWNPE